MLKKDLDKIVEEANAGADLSKWTELSIQQQVLLKASPVPLTAETALEVLNNVGPAITIDQPILEQPKVDGIQSQLPLFPNMTMFQPAVLPNKELTDRLDRIERMLATLLAGQSPAEQ